MKLDLKELLAKVTGQTEFKTLLWTNPSPAAGFVSKTLLNNTDLTVYDEIEVHGVNYTGFQSIMPPIRVPIGSHGNLIGLAGSTGDSSGTGFLVARAIYANGNNVLVSSAMGVPTNGTSWYQNDSNMIPTKIYGIKYVGGGYCLTVFSRLSAIFGLGVA